MEKIELANPTENSDVVNKGYFDSKIQIISTPSIIVNNKQIEVNINDNSCLTKDEEGIKVNLKINENNKEMSGINLSKNNPIKLIEYYGFNLPNINYSNDSGIIYILDSITTKESLSHKKTIIYSNSLKWIDTTTNKAIEHCLIPNKIWNLTLNERTTKNLYSNLKYKTVYIDNYEVINETNLDLIMNIYLS